MRNMLMASAAAMTLALAVPAMAQTDTAAQPGAQMPKSGQSTTSEQSTPAPAMQSSDDSAGGSMPAMKHKMHARAAGTGMMLGADATPDQYLTEAQRAAQHHNAMRADDALEHAETRLLDRSTAPADAMTPDNGPRVRQIGMAREALAKRDWKGADMAIAEAMKGGGMTSGGGMSDGSSMNGSGMNGSSGGGANGMGTPAGVGTGTGTGPSAGSGSGPDDAAGSGMTPKPMPGGTAQ